MQKLHILLLVVAVVSVFAATVMSKKGVRKAHAFKRKRPLSENEQVVYWRLVQALPKHVVLAQVSVSSLLRSNDRAGHLTISQKSVDFVVCDKSFSVIAAIEIDDKTHARPDRQKADAVKNAAFESAGVRLIRWRSSSLPQPGDIVRTILGGQNEKHEIPGRPDESPKLEERRRASAIHGMADIENQPISNG